MPGGMSLLTSEQLAVSSNVTMPLQPVPDKNVSTLTMYCELPVLINRVFPSKGKSEAIVLSKDTERYSETLLVL